MTGTEDEASAAPPQGPLIPPWMVTFADLMALMMTFFVLLFSYSKVDEEKYKAMVGSMAKTFGGVQYIQSNSEDAQPGLEPGVVSRDGAESKPILDEQVSRSASIDETSNQDRLYQELKAGLVEDLQAQRLIVERAGDSVIIRFPEEVSFPSGSDRLMPEALALIDRVVALIGDGEYSLTVAGHTDDRPIATRRFRSNWELSTARAVSVAHQLLATGAIPVQRLVVSGYADARPLVANDSAASRARNRRVELIVEYRDEAAVPKQVHRPAS